VRILAIQPSPESTPLGPVTQLLSASILNEDAEHDLAVLDAQTIDFAVAQKAPFVLAASDLKTQTFLEQQLGVLSFIYGALRSKVEVVPTGQSNYVEVPIYSSGGSLRTVTPTTITAEFKEEELQVRNDALFRGGEHANFGGLARCAHPCVTESARKANGQCSMKFVAGQLAGIFPIAHRLRTSC
jgi:hypothetical protein